MSVLQLPLQKVRLGTLKVQKVASLMTSSPIDPGAAIKKYWPRRTYDSYEKEP